MKRSTYFGLRRLSYSISPAIVVTSVASLYMPLGLGEFIAIPGIVFEGWINLIIVKVVRDSFGLVGYWMYFSVLFYSLIIYLALLAADALRNEKAALR